MRIDSSPQGATTDHIVATYFYLRVGMAVLALVFPLLLWLYGDFFLSIPIQGSMSAYYHTEMRDAFVGILCAIGAFLFLYKGFTKLEDWLLNAAGLFAVLVAFFPMNPDPNPPKPGEALAAAVASQRLFACPPFSSIGTPELLRNYSDKLDRTAQSNLEAKVLGASVHGAAAALFFVCIWIVCVWCSRETVGTIPDPSRRKLFYTAYYVIGAAMVLAPLYVYYATRVSPRGADFCSDISVYRAEFAGVWAFALFWIVKSMELFLNKADRLYPKRRAPKEVAT